MASTVRLLPRAAPIGTHHAVPRPGRAMAGPWAGRGAGAAVLLPGWARWALGAARRGIARHSGPPAPPAPHHPDAAIRLLWAVPYGLPRQHAAAPRAGRQGSHGPTPLAGTWAAGRWAPHPVQQAGQGGARAQTPARAKRPPVSGTSGTCPNKPSLLPLCLPAWPMPAARPSQPSPWPARAGSRRDVDAEGKSWILEADWPTPMWLVQAGLAIARSARTSA